MDCEGSRKMGLSGGSCQQLLEGGEEVRRQEETVVELQRRMEVLAGVAGKWNSHRGHSSFLQQSSSSYSTASSLGGIEHTQYS